MSRVMGQNSLTPQGNNNLNFRLARDQVVHLETVANLYASRPHVKRPLKSGNVSRKRRHSLFKNL